MTTPHDDAHSSSGVALRCPECRSMNVDCTSDRRAHVHQCGDCGYRTEAAAVKR